MSRDAVFNLYNFAAYQLAWFAVILGAAHGYAWAGSAIALLVAGVHASLRRDALELQLMGVAALIGILVDSTLAMTGQVRFAAAWPIDLAPYWMMSLWIVFATTLNHSLRWLMYRPVAAALSGAIGGPLAYYAGAKLGALSLNTPAITLSLIAMLWVMAMVTFSMMVMRAATEPEAGRISA